MYTQRILLTLILCKNFVETNAMAKAIENELFFRWKSCFFFFHRSESENLHPINWFTLMFSDKTIYRVYWISDLDRIPDLVSVSRLLAFKLNVRRDSKIPSIEIDSKLYSQPLHLHPYSSSSFITLYYFFHF